MYIRLQPSNGGRLSGMLKMARRAVHDKSYLVDIVLVLYTHLSVRTGVREPCPCN